MPTDPAPASIGRGRLVIVAGCYADAAPAIGLAEAIAQQMRVVLGDPPERAMLAAIIGILARDPAVDAAEGAPVLTPPRPFRPGLALTREGLSAAYAADARAFRTRLERIATRGRIRWEFRSDIGLGADLAVRIRQPGDMIMLGHRRLLNTGAPVVVLCDAQDRRTLDLAAALARAVQRRLLCLPRETADDPARIDALWASALILAPDPVLAPGRLATLIEAARCPVLLAPDSA
ncbi:MAG: hypothetical protein HLUCCA12_10895 [Rhodobacteraceae bacterium HLUCCA12]|nr:MAG: hypothetical protein HLUCCA12_10895 [Rhodobacteraceae bacterium HLUCCA12]